MSIFPVCMCPICVSSEVRRGARSVGSGDTKSSRSVGFKTEKHFLNKNSKQSNQNSSLGLFHGEPGFQDLTSTTELQPSKSPYLGSFDLCRCGGRAEVARKWRKNYFTSCYYLTTRHAEGKTTGVGMQLSWKSCPSCLSSMNQALDSIPRAAETWARKSVPVLPALGRWKQAD